VRPQKVTNACRRSPSREVLLHQPAAHPGRWLKRSHCAVNDRSDLLTLRIDHVEALRFFLIEVALLDAVGLAQHLTGIERQPVLPVSTGLLFALLPGGRPRGRFGTVTGGCMRLLGMDQPSINMARHRHRPCSNSHDALLAASLQ